MKQEENSEFLISTQVVDLKKMQIEELVFTLLTKIGVDTAENELLGALFNIIQYYSFVSLVRIRSARKQAAALLSNGHLRNEGVDRLQTYYGTAFARDFF